MLQTYEAKHTEKAYRSRYFKKKAADVMRQIFGGRHGPTFYEGIVDAPTESVFDEKLSKLKQAWEEISTCSTRTKPGLSFHAWFLKYHASEMKACMLKPVRVAAGLGDPPAEFCTNDSEATLKQFLNFKKLDWPTFNDKIKAFTLQQQKEIEKTVLGIGQYRIRKEYQQFCVQASKWFTSSDEQKESILRKFHKASVDDKHCSDLCNPVHLASNSSSCTTVTDCLLDEAATKVMLTNTLSVDLAVASNITDIPILCLRQMWSKAMGLLREGNVVKAPCTTLTARMVASLTSKKPHFVSPKDGTCALFQCDDCPAFLQRHMCSHTIAAAEDNNMLHEYLECYAKFIKTPKGSHSVTPNLTQLSMSNLPHGSAGRKGAKAPKKKAIKGKGVIPDEQRKDDIATSTHTVVTEYEKGHGATLPADIDINNINGTRSQTTSANGSSWPPYAGCSYMTSTWNWDPFMHMPCSSGYYQPPTDLPYSSFYHHSGLQAEHSLQEASISSSQACMQSSSTSSTACATTSNPFYIRFLNGRIKVCAGCKGPHMKNADGGLLKPPHDICIAHKETITFLNPRTKLESSKEGNCYYHVNKACLIKKHPQFSAAQLVCPDDIILEDSHKMLLRDAIGYSS